MFVYIEITHEEPVVLPVALLRKDAVKISVMTSASDDNPVVYHLQHGGSKDLLLVRQP